MKMYLSTLYILKHNPYITKKLKKTSNASNLVFAVIKNIPTLTHLRYVLSIQKTDQFYAS